MGAVASFVAKEQMEFYPDELHRMGLYADAIALCGNVLVSEGKP